ncbi:MAG TPA: PQQ-binding-like beta-propeller repeat protein [Planctomycetota bacterium]|nr:PQQ-binding-like beta-propeller repeat protein [Planctomycetota bacterium]
MTSLLVWLALASQDWSQLQGGPGRTGYTDASVPFDRKKHGGPLVFTPEWEWEKPCEMSPLVQPIVHRGLALAGDYDGVLHAIDVATGRTAWTYRTGGLIYHTASADGELVFTGSQDGALHAVDLAGKPRWTFQTGRGIVSSPCVLDGAVFVTSKDGHLYALDAARGALRWQFPRKGDRALDPILSSPSAGGGLVTFGDESMTAWGLDARDGTLRWKTRLRGQSFMYFWPVLGEKTGIVVYRTAPVLDFHANLNAFDAWLERRTGLKRKEHEEARKADPDWTEHHRGDVQKEQEAIREYLRDHPAEQTCFVLDLGTGQERYLPPVAYTGGAGSTPAPPVLDDARGRGWMVFRTAYSVSDGGYMVRGYTDVGEWDPATGFIRQITKTKEGWETYHLIGDELVLLSANRDLLFLNSWPNNGAVSLDTHDSFNVCRDREVAHLREKLWVSNAGTAGGNGGGHGDATLVTAEGRILWQSARFIRASRGAGK